LNLKGRKWREGEDYIMRSFIICMLLKVKGKKLFLCLTKHHAMKTYIL